MDHTDYVDALALRQIRLEAKARSPVVRDVCKKNTLVLAAIKRVLIELEENRSDQYPISIGPRLEEALERIRLGVE